MWRFAGARSSHCCPGYRTPVSCWHERAAPGPCGLAHSAVAHLGTWFSHPRPPGQWTRPHLVDSYRKEGMVDKFCGTTLGVEWIVIDALSMWFSTHMIRGLIVQFKHNRVKVYHLYVFTHSSDFKPFRCKKRRKIRYSRTVLYAHMKWGAFQTMHKHQTVSHLLVFKQTHTHQIMTKYPSW